LDLLRVASCPEARWFDKKAPHVGAFFMGDAKAGLDTGIDGCGGLLKLDYLSVKISHSAGLAQAGFI
jgi:hypothetical protein